MELGKNLDNGSEKEEKLEIQILHLIHDRFCSLFNGRNQCNSKLVLMILDHFPMCKEEQTFWKLDLSMIRKQQG